MAHTPSLLRGLRSFCGVAFGKPVTSTRTSGGLDTHLVLKTDDWEPLVWRSLSRLRFCVFYLFISSFPGESEALYHSLLCETMLTYAIIRREMGSNWLLFSRSVVSNSLRPHELQNARLPCPSLSPGVCSNSCPLNC